MKTPSKTPSLLQPFVLASGFSLFALGVSAAPTTYSISSTSGTWGDAVWTPSGGDATSPFPNRAGDLATNGLGSASTLTLDIAGGGTLTVGKIAKTTGTSSNWTINAGSGLTAASLILDNTGGVGNAQIYTASGSSQMVVNADFQVANTDLEIRANAGASTTIGGAVTAFTGQTRTLHLINGSGGGVNLNGSVGTSGGNLHIVHTSAASNTGDARLSGTVGANVLSITQNATSAGSELIVNGNTSAFVGDVTVSAGSIDFTAANGGAGFTAAGGTLSGVGTVKGSTTVTGGNLAAGTDGTVGTLTFNGTLDIAGLNGTGQLKFDLGAVGASDKIVANAFSFGTGALNFDDFDFTAVSGFTEGTFTLFDSATSIAASSLGSSLTGTINGLAAELSIAGDDLILTVAAIPEPSTYAALAGALALSGAALRRRRQ